MLLGISRILGRPDKYAQIKLGGHRFPRTIDAQVIGIEWAHVLREAISRHGIGFLNKCMITKLTLTFWDFGNKSWFHAFPNGIIDISCLVSPRIRLQEALRRCHPMKR